MKRGIIMMIALSVLTMNKTDAQNSAAERLNSYKIAFFTRRLNLTPREAEKFWPVYNELQEKKNAIQRERMEINRNFNQNELNMSEKEMTEAADRLIALEVQEADLAMEYHKKFKEILSPVKVLRLYQAENQYKVQLLNELRQNRQSTEIKRGP